MSLDYIPSTKLRSCHYKYTNDVVLKEIRSLVKQEKHILEADNEILKRNNEDLSNKIQDLYDAFGITSRTLNKNEERYIDADSHIKARKHKSKRVHSKNFDLPKDKYYKGDTLNDLKERLAFTQESLSMMKLQAHEEDSTLGIKNKEMEILEKQNTLLADRIKNIENSNKDLQQCGTIMSKSLKNAQKKPKSNFDLSISKMKSPDNGSPTYIDIFDNKERAYAFYDPQYKSKKGVTEQFFLSGANEEEVLKNPIFYQESPNSPIYADVNSIRKIKLSSAERLPLYNLESRINDKKEPVHFHQDPSFHLEVDKEFVKLSHDHQLLNEKLDELVSNRGACSISVKDEENESLLKKTSEEVVKISTEQQQIINLLLKNATTLDQLQAMRDSAIKNHSHLQSEHDFTKSDEDHNNKNKQLKTLSCQTDAVSTCNKPLDQIERSTIENNIDILQLINDQNDKIRDLTEKFCLIQNTSRTIENGELTKSFNTFFDETEKAEDTLIKSGNSLEDISIITDIVQKSLIKDTEAFLQKSDKTKSMSSLLLSTSEEKYSHTSEFIANEMGQLNDSFNNIDNISSDLQFETVSPQVKSVQRASSFNEPNIRQSSKPTKSLSKIPRLITSRSLDLSDAKGDVDIMKSYCNDLESSYETLYDPVSSARYEKENTIPM